MHWKYQCTGANTEVMAKDAHVVHSFQSHEGTGALRQLPIVIDLFFVLKQLNM